MRVIIPAGYRFTPSQAEGDLTTQAAAELQHSAFQAIRAAMGWHQGTFSVAKFNQLLKEESVRIGNGTWDDYKRAKRGGSEFCLDRRTRGAIFVAVKTSRVLYGIPVSPPVQEGIVIRDQRETPKGFFKFKS